MRVTDIVEALVDINAEPLEEWAPWDEVVSEGRRGRGKIYHGLAYHAQKGAMSKGYVDLGEIDPSVSRLSPNVVYTLARLVVRIYNESGKNLAFIRDPFGHFDRMTTPEKFAVIVAREMASEFQAQGHEIAQVDDEEAGRWFDAAERMRNAGVTVTRVKGKTGSGFKVATTLTPRQVMGTS